MNEEQKTATSRMIESVFDAESELSFGENPVGLSSLVEFATCASMRFGGRPLALVLLKLKSNSTASLRDAALLSDAIDKNLGEVVLLSEWLSEQKQEFLRSMKQSFIDETGNAWFISEGIHIDIRGKKTPRRKSASPKVENVFSDKATLVLRALLKHEPIGIREMSRTLEDEGFQLTPGYISKTVASLVSQGYAVKHVDGTVSLRRKKDMLDDWCYAYAKLAPSKVKGFFLPVTDMDELVHVMCAVAGSYALPSGLAGASLVDPYASFSSVLLLARNYDAAERKLSEVGAREVDRGANIELVQPRYRVSAFYGSQDLQNCTVASDLQLYLDLIKQPKRGLEAAEHLFQRRLAPLFSKEEGIDE